MAETAHSPEPFRVDETQRGFLLFDALGDSIGALALETGDHPYEEQRANAHLFAGSPELLTWAQEAERFIAGFEDDELQGDVGLLLKGLQTAIAKCEGRL